MAAACTNYENQGGPPRDKRTTTEEAPSMNATALFHHDPDRSDSALDLIGETSQSFIKSEGKATKVMVASEGLSVQLKK